MAKKITKIVLISLGGLIGLALLVCAILAINHATYKVDEPDERIENTTGLVQASGRSLYDEQGNRLQLVGINAGQILIQEGWMGLFSLEPMRNEDGLYVKDKDGNIQYPEFSEEEFREGLKSNPNLASYDIDELMKYYWEQFFIEEDFRIIKEDLGLNTIRFPFYYLNILNEDLSLKTKEEAFWYLDWFLSMCQKYDLYCVLDLHGAPGSQNGYEHSGAKERVAGLWESEENVNATIALWDYISEYYTNDKPELGKVIATYDILNEPTIEYKKTTTKACWDVFDKIYDVIRENGDNHVITFEGCWSYAALPDPEDYGWENIQYEYHWYNWFTDFINYDMFFIYQDMNNIGRDYDVPVLIGEFTAFEDRKAWDKVLGLFDERYYSWTVWNYKTCVTGWWTSSWGAYTIQMKAVTEWEETKCNVAICTYEEFIETCNMCRTGSPNCVTSTLYDVLVDYKNKG